MARRQLLFEKCPHLNGMACLRLLSMNKKGLWETMEKLVGKDRLAKMKLVCDVDGSQKTNNINNMNTFIRLTGRATFTEEGKPYFQVIECEEDELREWDVNEEGPVCNPVRKE